MLSDELVEVVELGKPYEIIGTIRTDRVGEDTLITVEVKLVQAITVHALIKQILLLIINDLLSKKSTTSSIKIFMNYVHN